MTDRATLLALADRCERATGTDRELDGAIAMAMFPAHRRGMYVRRHYTASLDAAVSAVPEGWRVSTADWSIAGRYTWMLKGPCTRWVIGPDGEKEAGSDWSAYAVSHSHPALALCAAALRAKAVTMEDGDE